MTVNDIKNIQILVNMKSGEKLMGITDDQIVIRTIAEFVQFVRVDEEKFNKVDIKEILK